ESGASDGPAATDNPNATDNSNTASSRILSMAGILAGLQPGQVRRHDRRPPPGLGCAEGGRRATANRSGLLMYTQNPQGPDVPRLEASRGRGWSGTVRLTIARSPCVMKRVLSAASPR